MAKVSVCIPAYNNRESVQRLLDSIKIQKFSDYEVIITDDSEGEDIRLLAQRDGKIRYYKNKTRLGAAANWNEAVKRCEGEYIKIMHHDDWFTEADSLGKLAALLDQHPQAALAFCGTRQVEEGICYDRHIRREDAVLIEEDYRNLFLGNTIGAPSAVICRRDTALYDEKLTWLVDMDYYMGILKKNPSFCYTEEPLISIGVSKSQLTEQCIHDPEINIREYGYIYKKYSLSEKETCKRTLLKKLMENNASSGQAKELGFTGREYRDARLKKLISKVKWKIGIRG